MLAQQHDVREWTRLLDELVLSLGEGDQPWQAIQLRRELDDVAESAADQAVDARRWPTSPSCCRALLAGRPSRASFRTGTLTVCTLVPMRSVPHRVVCLVGMDDGAFPRQGIADGDDVLAREPRTGERDVRSEDRQLFLDAICAAEEHLVIAYTGADPRTGAPVPPCVPLGELLDAVDASAVAPDGVAALASTSSSTIPLQPFDARNFRPGALGTAAPFSFDPSGLAGARAVVGDRVAGRAARLRRAARRHRQPSTVSLDDLTRFLQHPARGFLRQRLGIAISSSDEDPDDALPVELDGLQRWAIGDRVLRACLGRHADADRGASGIPARLPAARTARSRRPSAPIGSAGRRRCSRPAPTSAASRHARSTSAVAARRRTRAGRHRAAACAATSCCRSSTRGWPPSTG